MIATTTTTSAFREQGDSLGAAVPPFTPHAISVSLPTWRDNVGYEEGEKRVVDKMVSGYPRFFIHLSIQKLAQICEQKFGINDEKCLLYPTQIVADQCRAFMLDRCRLSGSHANIRLIQFLICPEDKKDKNRGDEDDTVSASSKCVELHIVLFPASIFPIAKQFWQHTGMGISSRLAEHCLSMLSDDTRPPQVFPPPLNRLPSKTQNRHYSVKGLPLSPPLSPSSSGTLQQAEPPSKSRDVLNKDHSVYLEERYGRNLPVASATAAKRALRRRIAGVLVRDNDFSDEIHAGQQDVEVGPSSRGVKDVAEDDVYLYPTGMSAIWQAHHLALSTRSAAKSVCFGFPYTDTLKILEKWGPGCHFLGHGLDADVEVLEKILQDGSSSSNTNASEPPILALFTEFPSNPLLRSADLPRLRVLADKYNFLLVVDETIGNFVNVEVLPYADIVVSSLSKIFSGDANVMGGSLVLNPKGQHYKDLKAWMTSSYEDFYFEEDAIYMERNSRNFRPRIHLIDENTEAVCDFLRSRSAAIGAPSPAIKEVFYPKYTTRNHYEICRIRSKCPSDVDGGFGGLFSLSFTSSSASRVFFDSLACYKGPSLGTNFTLACPYTVLAHYTELEWAASYGVEEGLVRISVGLEDKQVLLGYFEAALKAAEAAFTS